MTNKPEYRLPAEWERQECVMMSWPHPDTDWHYMLDEAEECFARVAAAIVQRACLLIVCPDKERPLRKLQGRVDLQKVRICQMPTNDTWARDFGPITLINNKREPTAALFKFNGWGLKFPANLDNAVSFSLWIDGLLCRQALNNTDFVLEGGSIDSDGCGTLLTTSECLLQPNRNGHGVDYDIIEGKLMPWFELSRILWLEHGYLEGDDTDSHVDTLARFLSEDTIAYATCDRENDPHYDELKAMEQELKQATTIDGKPYRLVPLPIPHPICDQDGNRLPATYANFLILNGAILLPVYGDDHYDEVAMERLAEACPEYDVVPVNCTALIQQHGSLHCITMQLPFLPKIFSDTTDREDE